MTLSIGASVSSITTYFDNDFPKLKAEWEASLLKELKITELGHKGVKKQLDGTTWPTLSLDAKIQSQLDVKESWKKASVTYATVPLNKSKEWMKEDLAAGVRNFFFKCDFIGQEILMACLKELSHFATPGEIEVFFLGEKKFIFGELPFKLIQNVCSGKDAHDQGGDIVLELALLTSNLIEEPCTHIGVFVDSHFFNNIAKIRAAKLLSSRVQELLGKKNDLRVVALTSYLDWTLYERYSNILRNQTAVASALIAGADHIQSSGYNILLDLETQTAADEHTDRSRRMARNTSHVLALESMLGVVKDAAYGSFHLENLTQYYCKAAWEKMQAMADGKHSFVASAATVIRERRQELIRTRKHVQAGLNDFADRNERLRIVAKPGHGVMRTALEFEGLRLKVEKLKATPEVYVALFGDYSALSGRLNFVKNYFEILGLEVSDPKRSVIDVQEFQNHLSAHQADVLVVCALDSDHPKLLACLGETKNEHKFLAGKTTVPGYTNLFVGQDVYETLNELVSTWGTV
ncbi:MAG TPA: methylmalonyl-CoA mutase family protein [Bacteriovoracaceae bacterium]|nr:methylmalonyl-CoA mutase family protein [Bacteriovoracaceae bacterium]